MHLRCRFLEMHTNSRSSNKKKRNRKEHFGTIKKNISWQRCHLSPQLLLYCKCKPTQNCTECMFSNIEFQSTPANQRSLCKIEERRNGNLRNRNRKIRNMDVAVQFCIKVQGRCLLGSQSILLKILCVC